MITILVALVTAVGFVLPGFAQMPACHEQHAHAQEMSPTVMAHHHALGATSADPSKCHDARGKVCPVCAMMCCGVILPAMALIPLRTGEPHAVFAAAPRVGRGVLASLDPYPPRRTVQS
jgi:hypothetical protein